MAYTTASTAVTMDHYSLMKKVEAGSFIRWVGRDRSTTRDCTVYLHDPLNFKPERVEVHIDMKYNIDNVLACGEAMHEYEGVDVLPTGGTERWAAIHGINVGGMCKPGGGARPTAVSGCVCAYDIETDISDLEGTSFPLPDARIISIAVSCSCGLTWVCTTDECDAMVAERADSTPLLISMFLDWVKCHMPLWLVGWNSFCFDNSCLMMSASREDRDYFVNTTVKLSSGPKRGYIINIAGINNVDLYLYLDRTQRSRFKNLSLGNVAAEVGAPLKTQMPLQRSGYDISEMIAYNINDSFVTWNLWVMLKTGPELINMCTVSCSPVVDCIRYVTGSMSVSLIASQCIAEGCVYPWGTSKDREPYQGGYVMEPQRGTHDDVAVCDFASMYPTIIMSANISVENLHLAAVDPKFHHFGRVDWDDDKTTILLGDRAASFDRHHAPLTSRVVNSLVTERSKYKKVDVHYSTALKVMCNSLYGALGYENSPLYAPSCSSSITAIGRWCLVATAAVFDGCGLNVIYGDTDSCFVTCKDGIFGDTSSRATVALKVLKVVLSYTPMQAMSMEIEQVYKRMLLIRKKNYVSLALEGKMSFKGISVVRSDTLGICKALSTSTLECLLTSSSRYGCLRDMAVNLADALDRCAEGALRLSEVSKITKVDGVSCYVYVSTNDVTVPVPMDGADPHGKVSYSKGSVARKIRHDFDKYSVAGGYGTASEVMQHHPATRVLEQLSWPIDNL